MVPTCEHVARKAIVYGALVGALLLVGAWLSSVAPPHWEFAEANDVSFGMLAAGGALTATGAAVGLARTAMSRRLVNYFSLVLFVPGAIGAAGCGLAAYFLQQSLADAWGAWLVCGLATLCGVLLAVGTVERADPLAERFEREIAGAAPSLGLFSDVSLSLGVSPRGMVVRTLLFVALIAGEIAYFVWKGAEITLWLALAWPIAWATLAVHELAHALWARVLGYRVSKLTIGGAWARLPEFKIGGVSVALGPLPLHGSTALGSASEPAWRAISRIAWAGPASGALIAAASGLSLLQFPLGPLATKAAILSGLWGLVSLGQLAPDRARIGDRAAYTDGFWLFMPQRLLRRAGRMIELTRLRQGLPSLTGEPLATRGLLEVWRQLADIESPAAQRQRLLGAFDAISAEPHCVEHDVTCAFLIGSLARFAPGDDDFVDVENAVARFVAGDSAAIFKTCLLDVLACHILFEPRESLLPLAERWARKALSISPSDPTLYGTLGAVLVQRGEREEGRRLLRELLIRSTSASDRQLARRLLARA